MTTKVKAYVGGSSGVELWRMLAKRANSHSEHATTALPTGQGQSRALNIGPLGLRFVHDETLPHTPPDDGRLSDILAQELCGLSLPVCLLSPDATSRRTSHLKRCLCWPHELPPRSLLGLSRRVRLCSAELCFLQMARSLDLIELIELGYELCGSYSLPPREGDGHIKRMPLTSTSLLRSFADRFPKAHGSRIAKRALVHVCDGSASPAETKLCMLLSLPSRLGGQGLPTPMLNHRIRPEDNEHMFTAKSHFACDLYWPDARLDVEYDSDRWHSGGIRRASDAARRGDLKRLGIDVIEVTAGMLFDQNAIDVLGDDLAHRLKVRRRTESYDVKTRRRELHARLIDPMRKVSGGWAPSEDDSARLASWPELR